MIHRLTFSGGAQSVRTVVLRDDGRPIAPASATFAVVDLRHDADDASHEVETGNATVDSVATTISAAAGRSTTNPRVVTVASAVGIVAGRRYLLSASGRAPEIVHVTEVSGTTLVLASSLGGAFPSGSAFTGVELSATVSADVCAEEEYLDQPNRLAIRWTPAGHRPFIEALHIERLAVAPLVSPDEILKLDATLHAYLDGNMSIADALAQAVEDFNVEMLTSGVDDDEILAGPIGRSALKYRAAWHVLKGSTDVSAVSRAERYDARWQHLVSELVQGWDKAKTARLTKGVTAQPPDLRSRFAGRW